MTSRRQFIQATMLLSAGGFMPSCGTYRNVETGQGKWLMPDEAESHQRTWMAFGASEEIWGGKLLSEVRRNLATLKQTLSPSRHCKGLFLIGKLCKSMLTVLLRVAEASIVLLSKSQLSAKLKFFSQ
jgi:hypothetical protein